METVMEHTGNGNGVTVYANGIVDPFRALADAIGGGGVPGVDYPILAFVPATGFSCNGQLPGYYADTSPEARCQVSAKSSEKTKLLGEIDI
ncbi:uncharacterized protein LOC119597936 isoform X2 [Penaeus monodon]|uniref:uncharacterized protein LOC119597936 isoform X2 n=1 Tax=Penaeus monodon TaxID=6687 RepID=UPI0018A7C88B|nr:uncharacterized protein LOC119597936 isoform X2 [Penaeus monodon]